MKTPAFRFTRTAPAIFLIALFGFGSAVADECSTVSFPTARTFDAGPSPRNVAVDDFNGDGHPDLAVANSAGASVLLGKGDLTFQVAVSYAAGDQPSFVVVGDFNGDGKPDLAVANRGLFDQSNNTTTNSSVSVLLGKGDGTFKAAVNYAAGVNPSFVAVGDLNGDGKADLVVANGGLVQNNNTDSSVSVLLGHGDGTFQPAVNYSSGQASYSVAMNDFNADGKVDLVVANGSRNVALLFGRGDGTFQSPVNLTLDGYGPLVWVVVSDFNGDEKPDLALATYSGVSVLLGHGDGTFQPQVTYDVGPYYSIVVGDFNRDGKPDLAAALGSDVSIFLGNGDGTFQQGAGYAPGGSLGTGDFDGDGKLDLVLAANMVSLMPGQGDGTFEATQNYRTAEPKTLLVGDFNGDSQPDLAVINSVELGTVSVLLGRNGGSFQAPIKYDVGTYPSSLAAGDFNGDGKLDFAVGSDYSNSVSMLLGKGDGTYQPAVSYAVPFGVGPGTIAAGDFNADGNLDLAIPTGGGFVSVLLGKGDGSFQAPRNVPLSGLGVTSLAAGDLNGDGKLDLFGPNYGCYSPLCAVPGPGSLWVLLGKGDGSFQSPVSYMAGAHPTSVAMGDFNGDNKPDLAVASAGDYVGVNYVAAGVFVLLGHGDGTFADAVSFDVVGVPNSVVVGDFDRDGKPDLAVAGSKGVSVFLGMGDGTFRNSASYPDGGGPLAVGDFNVDGRSDLAVADNYPGNVSVFLSTSASDCVGLTVVASGANIRISWPTPFSDFVLETSTSLNSTDWLPASEVPATNNASVEVSVPRDQQQRYFRLHKR